MVSLSTMASACEYTALNAALAVEEPMLGVDVSKGDPCMSDEQLTRESSTRLQAFGLDCD